ncbi:MAG: NAD-dependent epimerase/dehydratase family protein [bacterium]|nr:NAD-dependent epimerase/dehydratase family protein [bacterium]
MKTVLLTGSAGTIGTALRKQLGNEYHFRCLDLKAIPEIDDMWVADIADFHTVYQAMLGVDAVIHLAANLNNDRSWHDVYTSGIGGTYSMITAWNISKRSKVIVKKRINCFISMI